MSSGPGGESKLTHELIEDVCKCLRKGNYRKTAFALNGIPRSTWTYWVKHGKQEIKDVEAGRIPKSGPKGQSLRAILVRKMECAEAEAIDGILTNVLESGDPSLGLKFLTMRHSRMFNSNPTSHYDDETGTETKMNPMDIARERLKQLMSRSQPNEEDKEEDGG